jgi:DNA-binding LacI/PurR family transcriptional regulator
VSRPPRVTMHDVARSADVSIQTVSNVVNGRIRMVSSATRDRVERVMAELDYHPDAGARSLRSGRARALAFLIVDEHRRYLADPLTDLLLAGVGDVARDRDYGVLIQASRPGSPADGLLRPLAERRADGACVVLSGAPATRRRHVERLGRLEVPFALFDEPVDHRLGISVVARNEEGARRLTHHLVARGHRRIAFVAARVPWPVIEQRHRGYLHALAECGVERDRDLERFDGELGPEGGEKMVRRLLGGSHPPTAVMATSDLLALGAIRAARSAGVDVPAQLAVTGFDDFEFSAFAHPPLTTVHVPAYEMGRRAAEALIDRIEGATGRPAGCELPVELRVRESS